MSRLGVMTASGMRFGRLTLDYPLPDGVRRHTDMFGIKLHQFLRRDGTWSNCQGKGRCPECMREEAMKSTELRVREALEEHFGLPHLMTLNDDTDLFLDPPRGAGRTVGDRIDRTEMVSCLEHEFEIELRPEIGFGRVTVRGLAMDIDDAIAGKG